MESVTISPKFQLVVPKHVRERMDLQPGQKFQVFESGSVIRFVPVIPIGKARGLLRGLKNDFQREKIDRDVSPS